MSGIESLLALAKPSSRRWQEFMQAAASCPVWQDACACMFLPITQGVGARSALCLTRGLVIWTQWCSKKGGAEQRVSLVITSVFVL